MGKEYYAIIDIGSNTVRLVIYLREKSGRFQEIENVKAVARLRNYLEETNVLNQEGIEVLLKILKSFKEVTDTYDLNQIICVATATIRQAENQQEIISEVEQKIGYTIQTLSEQEEAYYGYLAVVNSTAIEEGITVDIGGGSTEITYFENREMKHSHSFPFGALTLKQMFVKNDVPTEKEMHKVRDYLREQFSSLPWLKSCNVPLIGIGGSARNMVQVDQALKSYPLAGLHQYRMYENDMAFIKNYLLTLSFKKLQKVEGLTKDRADIILPAIEVFHSLYEYVDSSSFILSRKGLRDGIFYEQLTHDFGISVFPNVIEESFNELAVDFDIDYKHVHKVTDIALQLFEEFRMQGIGHVTKADAGLLRRGAFVFNLGEYIDSESSSQHTFYLLANRTIDGLLHKERLKIALIASYKSKPIFKQYLSPYKHWFVKEEQKKLRTIGALIKLAFSFDSTRRSIVDDLHIDIHEEDINITAYCNQESMPEEYQVEKQKKHLEKALKKKINVVFQPNEQLEHSEN
ncbi:exopolyphosphatase [Pontibacillus yanchengensis]|uniref:Exopolyphosphatase n=1 Tax=Pontibacillus yanchengensis Y32 TaxID=1385514 RepID=A0A0A2T641_9BACI|nr:exopolyphosphatase [Pontibacillus yanchengensis]KGP70959.1 exopolyphosphatase [Pontibacillus yanchengensis Y32]